MPARLVRRLLLSTLFVLSFALAGCTSGGTPQEQQAVKNEPDHFLYELYTPDRSSSDTYTWHNSQARAAVTISAQLIKGSAHIKVLEAKKLVVYEKFPGSPGRTSENSTTSVGGSAGDWTVIIDLGNAQGLLYFALNATK